MTESGTTLEWQCHPVKRRPKVSLVASLFVFAVVAGIYYSTESHWLAILSLFILFASLAKFYFPTKYRLTDSEIVVKTTTQTLKKTWSQYRSCYPDKNGILLSPFVEPSRLENFRGLFLMFEGNRDEVIAFVKDHIGKEEDAIVTGQSKGESQ